MQDVTEGRETIRKRSILHGLCTLGYALRAVMRYVHGLRNRQEQYEMKLSSLQCSFVKPVFVNDVLQKLTRMLNYQQYYEKILKLKQQMFKICLYGPYYTMFATYMQQRMPTVDIDGQKIPIFDLDYIQDPPRLTVTAADGTVIDCKILHLFILITSV